MEIQFERTFDDYKEAIAAERSRSLRTKIAITVSFWVIFVLGMIVLVSLGLTMGKSLVLMFAGTIIFAKGLPYAYSLWLKGDFRRHPNFASVVHVRIDDLSVNTEAELWKAETKWSAYIKYRETPKLFLLYLGARSVEILPKRAFSGEQVDKFRQLVQAKLSKGQPNLR